MKKYIFLLPLFLVGCNPQEEDSLFLKITDVQSKRSVLCNSFYIGFGSNFLRCYQPIGLKDIDFAGKGPYLIERIQ